MTVRGAVDELDALVVELGELRERLAAPGAALDPVTLWEVEVSLRHLGQRATARADLLRRAIEVQHQPRSA